MTFDRVEDAIEDIRQGRMVIVADDEDRENEGDLVLAAGSITPDHINFMTKYGRGLICVALTDERADERASLRSPAAVRCIAGVLASSIGFDYGCAVHRVNLSSKMHTATIGRTA